MTTDPLAFLDQPQSSSKPKTSSDALSFLDQPQESEWKKRTIPKPNEKWDLKKPDKSRNILADAVTSSTAVLGGIGDLASLAIGENPLTSKSLREGAFSLFPSLAPQNDKEKEWDENLSIVMGLASPGGGVKTAGKLVGKGISKLGGSKVSKALKGKYNEMYDLGKSLGISEKALAPFKHGKVSEKALTHISKLGEEAKEGIKFAQDLAAPHYDKLYEAGSKILVNNISKRGVVNGLNDVINEIQKSPALVKESKDVVKFLEEAIHGVQTHPNLNVENLMALQKQLGKTVNWNSIKQSGKGRLVQEARGAVEKGIYGMNPKLGKEFSDMDKLYGAYRKLAKEVSPNKLYEYASKGGPAGYTLLSILTGHDIQDAVTQGLGVHFGKKALGKISGKLLTDPKWGAMKEKIVSMVKKGSIDYLPKMLTAIKKKANMEIPYFDLEDENSNP